MNRLTATVGGQVYAPQPLSQQNILIRDGKIQQITTELSPEEKEIISARDLIVAPGLTGALVHGGGG